MPTATRPRQCTDEMLEFLDDLRESGAVNMFGASRDLAEEFPDLINFEVGEFSQRRLEPAREVLKYWMDTFGERHGS